MKDDLIEMNIIALSRSKTSDQNFVLVLEDFEGKKRLPILIGAAEAQYICITLEKLSIKRPLTHDLMIKIIHTLNATLDYVVIDQINEEIFHSKLVVKDNNQNSFTLDCRPSDAIALAVKTQIQIFVNPSIFDKNAYSKDIYSQQSQKSAFKEYSVKELEELLKNVLAKEDYESAIRIRETIKNRNQNLDNK
jgi:uncharacterized protein